MKAGRSLAKSPEALATLLANPDLFLLHYFPHRIDRLEPFHLELIDLALNERRGLELYPATHGKTTIASELLPILEICRDPNIRLANILKNEKDAKAISQSIQSELIGNTRLIEDFGPFKPDGQDGYFWSLGRFDVAKRTRKGKSSTFAAFGAGSRDALGYRTDHLTCDDIVTDKNSTTPEQRQKLEEWFYQGPATSPDRVDGRITVVGTAFHPDDLYAVLQGTRSHDGENMMWKSIVRKAILDWDEEKVLWPDMRPWLFLMEHKLIMGTIDFNKRFQNVAVDPSQMVFREEYIRGGYLNGERHAGCLDKDYCLGDVDDGWRVYTGFDPAVGISRKRKFCAHITLAVGSCEKHDRCFWVVDMKRDQMTLPQQVDLIIRRHQQYGAYRSVVEANAYQRGLYQAIQQRMEESNLALSIIPHTTSGSNKLDREIGVEAMSPWFELGKVHIPWGDQASRLRMQVFVDELVQYPGRTTDTVMAFWMAWLQAQQSAPKYKGFVRETPLFRPAGHNGRRSLPPGTTVVRNPFYAEVPVGDDS